MVRSYKFLLSFSVIITTLFSLLINGWDLWDGCLLIIATVLSLSLFSQYDFLSNIGKYVVLLTLWVSVVMMPAFHLVSHILRLYEMKQSDYDRICSFGAKIYFIVVVSWLILGTIRYGRKNNYSKILYQPIELPEKIIVILLIGLFFLTAFCYVIGLGRMGGETIRLPFHLSGLINLFRGSFIPIFFIIIAENYILRGKKIPNRFYYLYGFWTLFESFAWMSKARLITNFEPLLILLYLYYRPKMKNIAKVIIPFILIFLFMYPIIGAMRNLEEGSITEKFSEARSMTKDDEDNDETIVKPLNRTFMSSYLYAQDYDYIDNESLFDFSKTAIVVLNGGAPAYQTVVIDGYSVDVAHSSGTSGLMDPLLHGGYGLCFIFVILFMVFATWLDVYFKSRKYSICVVLLLSLWQMVNFLNISSFYDGVGLQGYFVTIITIYTAWFINFRKINIPKNYE